MSAVDGFYTINGSVTAEQVIEKSRFIASASYVATAEDVQAHMRSVRDAYPNARHYVYAYRLQDGRAEKSSDDGEPQGTGGKPVLDLLQYRQIWNAQIIVVRYFGGILLGTGGLTRAYGGTARQAVNEADIVKLVPHYAYRLGIPYSWYEQIKYGLKQKGWDYDNEQFQEHVSLHVYVTQNEAEIFQAWIDELTNKQVRYEQVEQVLRPGKL